MGYHPPRPLLRRRKMRRASLSISRTSSAEGWQGTPLRGLDSVSFEILDGALVLLGCLPRVEGAQVPALACSWVLLAGIETVLTGLELSNHGDLTTEAGDPLLHSSARWGTKSALRRDGARLGRAVAARLARAVLRKR